MEKILQWFEQHGPFSTELPSLWSLTLGITAAEEDDINCDETEAVGEKIHWALDSVPVTWSSWCPARRVHRWCC